MAHAFVAGGESCDTERDISVGGVQHVPGSVFAGIDYVALGHLHGRQWLGSGLCYSGSPLAFSFSEAGHTKSSYLVNLTADGLDAVEDIPTPVPRRMARLTGTLDDLLTSPAYGADEDCWVEATLTDPVRPLAPYERLKQRFPHLLKLVVPSLLAEAAAIDHGDFERLAPVEVALRFIAEVRNRPADADETALLHRAFDELRRQEANA
jgi:exonuclease SbcD